MGFGAKTKTLSRLAGINKLTQDPKNAKFKKLLNDDPNLKQLNQEWVVLLGEIKSQALGVSGGNIARPQVTPIPKARWYGEFSFDTTEMTVKDGKKKYTYKHAKAGRANAAAFRDRIDNILKVQSQENDAINSPDRPNRGGQAGTHFNNPGANDPTKGL